MKTDDDFIEHLNSILEQLAKGEKINFDDISKKLSSEKYIDSITLLSKIQKKQQKYKREYTKTK